MHALLEQLEAGDDAGQQVVEVMRDAAGQLAQRVHLLRLHQLRFGANAFGHLAGQLRVRGLELLALGSFTLLLLGDVLDEHQPALRIPVRRDLPLGLAPLAGRGVHDQGVLPASAACQTLAQRLQFGLLALGDAGDQFGWLCEVAEQPRQGTVALVNPQLGVDDRDWRCDLGEDFPEACFAFTQRVLGVADAQQGAQGGKQDVRVDRVNQIGIGPGLQTGDDVARLDGCRRDMDDR